MLEILYFVVIEGSGAWTPSACQNAFTVAWIVNGLGLEKCLIFPEDHQGIQPSFLLKASNLAFQIILGRRFSTSESESDLARPFHIASKLDKYATPLVTDSEDDEAIHDAAHLFAAEVEPGTGLKPKIYNNALPKGTERAIVVGSVGNWSSKGSHPSWTGETEGKWEFWN